MRTKLKRLLFSLAILCPMLLPFASANSLEPRGLFLYTTMLLALGMLTFLPLNLLLAVVALFFAVGYYWQGSQFTDFSWPLAFLEEFRARILSLLAGDIGYFPEDLATVLFLILLLLLSLLLMRYRRWGLATTIAIGYLVMLAIFNQSNHPIAICLILGGMLGFWQSDQPLSKRAVSLYLLLATLLIGGSVLLPRSPLQNTILDTTQDWRDELNQQGVYDAIQHYGNQAPARTGFGEDDSTLGGPLLDNQDVVFRATVSKQSYWRVETKETYTGTGWETNERRNAPSLNEAAASGLTLENVASSLTGPIENVTIIPEQPLNYVPIPYGNVTLSDPQGLRGRYLQESNRIILRNNVQPIELDWQPLTLPAHFEVGEPGSSSIYTQLPENFSFRVQELAEEITADADSTMEKIEAIIHYLRITGGLRYSKTDTPFLPEGRDYVEFFLFDSKVGYCDNFSTAMVTMLRSLGIPARWAKGFSDGTVGGRENNRLNITVTNANAHSWPEVYLESYGWIPFEPTPTFTGAVREEQAETTETAAAPVASSETTASTTTETTVSSSQVSTEETTTEEQPQYWWLLVIPVILLFHRLILTGLLMGLIQLLSFSQGYRLLLWWIERRYPRKPGETLSAYAQRLQAPFSMLFTKATQEYTESLYRGNAAGDKTLLLQLAKQVLKKQPSKSN
ncbi:transglutaminase TgpA family protein [Enterococcus canis]|nr:transglutaminase domain-containing protein [Enterococcus canis]